MALSFPDDVDTRFTQDIDAVVHPQAEVCRVVEEMAKELGLSPAWLNSNGAPFAPPRENQKKSGGGVEVTFATVNEFIAMELAASKEQDLHDLGILARHAGNTKAEELVDLAFDAYGDGSVALNEARDDCLIIAERVLDRERRRTKWSAATAQIVTTSRTCLGVRPDCKLKFNQTRRPSMLCLSSMEVVLTRRRGFFAELQYQSQVAARQAAQHQRAVETANRRAEQARNASLRAQAAFQRASEADRKRLEKEAAMAHIAAMQAEVDEMDAALAGVYEDLDNLLKATLEVDDFVDLESLRQVAQHPPFDRAALETPIPSPPPIADPIEPTREPVEAPKGLFGKKKKLEEAQANAEAEFVKTWQSWWQETDALPARRAALAADHAVAEAARESSLASEKARYANECADRETSVAENNASLDEFIANLGYGTVDAVHEYVGIVLANSTYPEHFEVGHEPSFEPSTAELTLKVVVPGPDEVPTVKAHKYSRASDEITTVPLSQKDAKGRYANVVHQVALRTIHEVFEADRRNLIQAISLVVGADATNPATGKPEFVTLVAVSASRDRFIEIDLSAVVPAATLDHLGAAVSKSPFDLAPASGAGVRHY